MCEWPNQSKKSQTMTPLSPMESNSFTEDMSYCIDTEHSFSSLLEFAADNDVEGFRRSAFDESEVKEVGLWYSRQGGSRKMVLEQRTPLMIAAKYGSVDIVKLILSLPELLLLAGADTNAFDTNGCRPIDVIVTPSKFPHLKIALEELLKNGSVRQWDMMPVSRPSLRSSSPSLSSLTDEGSSSSPSGSILSPVNRTPNDVHVSSAKKGYPVDPTIPDIKNSVYASDEFRMFSFKIQRCSRAYAHDWTECPFVHPGENARRRDPRKFYYSCAPCPDHRNGTCRRGDLCENAHGIFESWLHPTQYKTRLCKEGTNCMRRVCFFAHKSNELRPLNMSTGAASSKVDVMDFTTASKLLPSSPSAVSSTSPSTFNPLKHLSSNSSHPSVPWPQQTIPNLHNGLQASRLRSSLNARDISSEELNGLRDFAFQQHLPLNEPSSFSQLQYNGSSNDLFSPSNTLNHSNLDKMFNANVSSPQYSEQLGGSASVFFPTYSSAALNQQQQHPKSKASRIQGISPYINDPVSSLGFQQSAHVRRERMLQQLQSSLLPQKFSSKPSYDLGSNGTNSWSKWKSENRNVDRFIQADEVGQPHTSSSIEHVGEEPDVSWVHSMLKDSPSETNETTAIPVPATLDGSTSNPHIESSDYMALQAWLEGLQLDQNVV
ncbi:PREDICTED: zinc finger CCCH domain-containing protein 56-like isoform X2 [Populus euphratica]|uniref:Zinc finger CCCH domain-containing protein 56-like isoform X2 n=2 Tax=Populus euphratica TaxID=75702 RepID=A0AAJ6X591_POPEU|nr:PREDICTED: zinc finger CCCH domain-containing protein 56-like isoform X2 [Populus euphratica]